MPLRELLRADRVPAEWRHATLVLGDADTLVRAEAFLARLETALGRLVLGVVGQTAYPGRRIALPFPARYRAARKRLLRLAPKRLIALGSAEARHDLVATASCPCYWVNARDAASAELGCRAVTVANETLGERIPTAVLTGDPLLGIESLPEPLEPGDLCERFRAYRDAGQPLIYFAGTDEGEEAIAYGALFQILRHRPALMLLAPRMRERLEPVYREALKYNLPTIRHSRLMTSQVPGKNRVYYVETPEALQPLMACADIVVAGGTLADHAAGKPDVTTPLQLGKPVIVGGLRRDPIVAEAAEAGAVAAVDHTQQLGETLRHLCDDPEAAARLAATGQRWLVQQADAGARVLGQIAG